MSKIKKTSGFVYIWRDKKHNRYYIGSHWGLENDNYICSSRWMRKSFKRRPQDFKRRVISRITTNIKDLLTEEHRWLFMIPDEELGKRYYNLTKHHNGHWSTNPESKLTVGQKISKKNKGRTVWNEGKSFDETFSPEKSAQLRESLRKAHTGVAPPNKGKSMEEFFGEEKAAEIRQRQSEVKLGNKATPESKEKCRQSMLKYHEQKRELLNNV